METRRVLFVLLLMAGVITGCQKHRAAPYYDRPLPPGELALRKITDPREIPDFTDGCYNMARMQTAIDNSLNYLNKPSSRQFFPYGAITHQRAVDSLKA
ncbi:MAG: hypothetical protein ACYSR4_10175, partial [Planctomycetota bacterium]